MNTRVVVTVLAICLSQALARPSQMLPHEAYGDLNMPGFWELNLAINSGTIDLAPALNRLPAERPKDSLGKIIALFFSDVADSCYRRGEDTMAASLEALQEVAPEFEQLAEAYSVLDQSWDMVVALKGYGAATIGLRTQLEGTVEVMQDAVTPIIMEIKKQVYALGKEPELSKVQQRMEKLIKDSDLYFSNQVSDTAEVLRDVSRMLGDILNYRVMVTQDLQNVFSSVIALRADLENALSAILTEVQSLHDELKRLQSQGMVSQTELIYISTNVAQVEKLVSREVHEMALAVNTMFDAAVNTYNTLQSFPY